MHIARQAFLSILVLASLLALLPGIAYAVGLFRVHGRPVPADPTAFDRGLVQAAWQGCREESPIAVTRLNPWGVAARLLFGDPLRAAPGERASWQIARTHNAAHPVGNNLWWHTSGTALTIWITRNWSAEQIGATLARDGLCK
ncbi:hypothetical protein QF205_11605 [Luteimonas composti]|uniref:Uncharacterized protein n=1 Tax=Luteimonas composti TaxID=398257 RepID=A0ABT6MSS1_9GAMM|nr:hypothetical protein [Luteimonas composti]MDH7453706.1 hypothetical protein [Luteimonas composti]